MADENNSSGFIPSDLPPPEPIFSTGRDATDDAFDATSSNLSQLQAEINQIKGTAGGTLQSGVDAVTSGVTEARASAAEALGLDGLGGVEDEVENLISLICYPLELIQFYLADLIQRFMRKYNQIKRIAEQLENLGDIFPPLPDISGFVNAFEVSDLGVYDKIREACPELGLPSIGGSGSFLDSLVKAYQALADMLKFHPFAILGELLGLLDGLITEIVNTVSNFVTGNLANLGECICNLCGIEGCEDGSSNSGALSGYLPGELWNDWLDFLGEKGDDPFRWANVLTPDQNDKYDTITTIIDTLIDLSRPPLIGGNRGIGIGMTTFSRNVREDAQATAAARREEQLQRMRAAGVEIDENTNGAGFIFLPAIRRTRERLGIA